MTIKTRLAAYGEKFSFIGLAIATLFFAASVTPSLLPRHFIFQGILSGFALAAGYGLGVGGRWLYRFLEIPEPAEKIQRISMASTSVVVVVAAALSLYRMTFWQNEVRARMQMPEVETAYPWRTMFIALAVGMLIIAAARLIALCFSALAERLSRIVPPRISKILSAVLVLSLLLLVGEGLVARALLSAAESASRYADGLIDDGVARPQNPLASGSDESLIDWDLIGRRGKNFVVGGPTKEEIAEFLQQDALQPIRVYAGMRSGDSHRQRARLALEELKRVGGFDRSHLIIATPTGTGWLDPGGVDPVEYVLGGDSAIVSTQYSYMPSWLTILVDPKRSIDSARALFDEVYSYWTTLPETQRPKLYLFGLSLGALGGEVSADLVTVFEDPIQGAVFSGPPFPSRQWQRVTADRDPNSPQWLPSYRDGRLVRFINQFSPPNQQQPWGPMRYVYIQYASDPMVFFSPSLLFSEPDWMRGERGVDVSPHLQWRPLVTFLQILFDLPMATSVPSGYGHNYSPRDYIEAWVAVLDPPEWSQEATARLKSHFEIDR